MYAVDESGALSILQWVLSSRPEPAAAEQQLHAAWKMVSSCHAKAHCASGVRNFAAMGGVRLPVQQAASVHQDVALYSHTSNASQRMRPIIGCTCRAIYVYLLTALHVCSICCTIVPKQLAVSCASLSMLHAACRLTHGQMAPHAVRCCAWLAALPGLQHCAALHSWQSSVRAGQLHPR
jgi:hypothetical protein